MVGKVKPLTAKLGLTAIWLVIGALGLSFARDLITPSPEVAFFVMVVGAVILVLETGVRGADLSEFSSIVSLVFIVVLALLGLLRLFDLDLPSFIASASDFVLLVTVPWGLWQTWVE